MTTIKKMLLVLPAAAIALGALVISAPSAKAIGMSKMSVPGAHASMNVWHHRWHRRWHRHHRWHRH